MWQVIETTEYFVKFIRKSQYEVYVTDFTMIWYLYSTQEQFIISLQEANPILEMTDADFLQKGKQMLLIPKNYQSLNISRENTKLQLSMVKRLPFKLKLELELNSGSNEMFFQQVTQPLLLTVSELKSSQLELRTQLNKKDKEIDEYKSKGVEISARHLKTNKFNESEHLTKYKMYEENFGASSLPEFLLKKPIGIKNEELIREEDLLTPTMKTEPQFQTNEVNIKQIKCMEVKTEQQTPMDDIALHTISTNGGHSLSSEVKTEPQTPTNENERTEETQKSVAESNSIKREMEVNNRIFSPKKKMKRLNL